MNKFIMEIDLETIVDNAIEKTIKEGLIADKDYLINKYDKDTFDKMQIDYRYYSGLFGINFKNNLEEIFKQVIREEKENM